jgi:hypothetical protein
VLPVLWWTWMSFSNLSQLRGVGPCWTLLYVNVFHIE